LNAPSTYKSSLSTITNTLSSTLNYLQPPKLNIHHPLLYTIISIKNMTSTTPNDDSDSNRDKDLGCNASTALSSSKQSVPTLFKIPTEIRYLIYKHLSADVPSTITLPLSANQNNPLQGLIDTSPFSKDEVDTWLLGEPQLRKLNGVGVLDVRETEWVLDLGLMEKDTAQQDRNCEFDLSRNKGGCCEAPGRLLSMTLLL
jgi:hypothetical protein